jgi:hypothetical protein
VTRESRLSAIATRDGDIINIENPVEEEWPYYILATPQHLGPYTPSKTLLLLKNTQFKAAWWFDKTAVNVLINDKGDIDMKIGDMEFNANVI